MDKDEIVAEFTQRTRVDIRACLACAAERERLSVGTLASAAAFGLRPRTGSHIASRNRFAP
jgi:hypothetical protein